jgi:hypothetical protein
MCRYTRHPVKTHWGCPPCRYTDKRTWRGYRPEDTPACPRCDAPMLDLGRDFKAPRRADRRQWRKVEVLAGAGITFDSCGCSGPGPRPRTLADARSQLGERRSRHRAGTRREVAMATAPDT